MLARPLRDPGLWAGLASGDVDVAALVEELLRVDTSVIGLSRQHPGRHPARPGRPARTRAAWIVYAAANRDPDVFPDPHAVTPGRSNIQAQLTFDHGRHVCIGATLARTQIALAISALVRTHPTLGKANPWHVGGVWREQPIRLESLMYAHVACRTRNAGSRADEACARRRGRARRQSPRGTASAGRPPAR